MSTKANSAHSVSHTRNVGLSASRAARDSNPVIGSRRSQVTRGRRPEVQVAASGEDNSHPSSVGVVARRTHSRAADPLRGNRARAAGNREALGAVASSQPSGPPHLLEMGADTHCPLILPLFQWKNAGFAAKYKLLHPPKGWKSTVSIADTEELVEVEKLRLQYLNEKKREFYRTRYTQSDVDRTMEAIRTMSRMAQPHSVGPEAISKALEHFIELSQKRVQRRNRRAERNSRKTSTSKAEPSTAVAASGPVPAQGSLGEHVPMEDR
jgi:hypothetical protein